MELDHIPCRRRSSRSRIGYPYFYLLLNKGKGNFWEGKYPSDFHFILPVPNSHRQVIADGAMLLLDLRTRRNQTSLMLMIMVAFVK